MTTRVLIVEDDDRVAAALESALTRSGRMTTRRPDGRTAIELLDTNPAIDIVLLDLGLPDIDGVDVCRMIRSRSGLPVIALTARAGARDRVTGLRSGADDYVVKPYAFPELLARMDAVLRRCRAEPVPAAILTVGDIAIDLDARRVRVAGAPVDLTRKEFDLLAVLATRIGLVIPREEVFWTVWQTDWPGTSRTLDTHVASLRHKLGRPSAIRTVRGVGLTIDPDPSAEPPRRAPGGGEE